MRDIVSDPSSILLLPPTNVPSEDSTAFVADDGFTLAGRVFRPGSDQVPVGVVIINSGAGIPQSFYRRFALGLAAGGLAAVTYDYRGIGDSNPAGDLRGFAASVEDWGSKDCAALLRTVAEIFPNIPLAVVGHSVGVFVTGFVRNPAPIRALVSLGGHTGYWRDYALPFRYPMGLLWHVLMPAVTKVVGYFPGRLFGLPSNLPKQMAMEWAGRLKPDFGWNLVTSDGSYDTERVNELHARFAAFRMPALAIRLSDDAFASAAATARIRSLFQGCQWEGFEMCPNDFGVSSAGHFGYFRQRMSPMWLRLIEWLRCELLGPSAV